jgi:addiction module HigA family antidote
MSVKDAAGRLGVGRPALSNFLNGKAALSPEMAARLEKAFGADQRQLLELQAAYDRHARQGTERELAVRALVPVFLAIRAHQIDAWANSQINARTHLPVLLRMLVHSTGSDLRRVDFPGYDNAQRKGGDGFVEAGAATPWIPEGRSYWEFGTDKRISAKADSDYSARLKTVPLEERGNGTFVFVTPRNWPGKTAWEEQKNKAGQWKQVRAFDASDLEQWLEQSVPAQIWLAEQLSLPTHGYHTLEEAWRRWAQATVPHLTSDLFAPTLEACKATFMTWLRQPTDRPFVVAADSREEALAFVACLADSEEAREFKDLMAVFTSPDVLRSLVASPIPFIPIVYSTDVERELVSAHKRLHCIVIRPRNAIDARQDITLDLLGPAPFEKALNAIGLDKEAIDRLARESGRSPTVLRRRLSPSAAIRTPEWASDAATARVLVPTALIGAWHADAQADREIIAFLADRTNDAFDADLVRLLRSNDPPVWSVGGYRGVTSKMDALFATADVVTGADIDRFFLAAEFVLSESDPALELPEANRWAAGLYGKKRDHSGALREGICETLVLLSVHGNYLFQARLGVNVESRVAGLVRTLLTPLTLAKLLSCSRELPWFAEAAPDELLKIIEDDLRSAEPIVSGLLKPVDSGAFFASPVRTGLLWALECLAWKPQNLTRVVMILAQLSVHKISDNWVNKPVASLQSIFRSWMPQTAASVDQRMKALETLTRRFPAVGWELCKDQLDIGSRVGHYNYRPRWRGDASGAGHGVTEKELYDFTRKAIDLMLGWPTYDEKSLGDMIESLQGIPEEYHATVWDLVDKWSQTATETAKAVLRERIRRFAFTRQGRRRNLGAQSRDRARETHARLQSSDPVIRHGWLFADQWVQESADELQEEELDYQKREERIDALRREAMKEIWTERGFEGVEQLLTGSGAAGTAGRYLALCILAQGQRVEFIRRCLAAGEPLRDKLDWCLRGFLHEIPNDLRPSIVRAAVEGLTGDSCTRLFVCAPFDTSTWRVLDSYDEGIRKGYWRDVLPSWGRHTASELTELIDRLLEAQRPRAAFRVVHLHIDEIETSRLKRLLRDVATVNSEPVGHYRLESHYISEALDTLQGRSGVTAEEMAQLEFLFFDALDHSKHGIPNLERQIGESSMIYVQALALSYRRSDAAEDPPEWRIENAEQRAAAAMAAHRILHRLKRIPGTDEGGVVDALALRGWLAEVRRLCAENGRATIGDHCLGQLLAASPGDEDGTWPCRAVCEVMEDVASPDIAEGFHIGVYNSRGVHFRGEGGEQERGLAGKYRAWAERLHFEFPYVGSVLEGIARSYEHEAVREDSEAAIRKRLLF